MVNNNPKIRLVAMIRDKGDYDKPDYEVLNFLSDIKIRKDMRGGYQRKDNMGRYCFKVEKNTGVQLPYSPRLTDLTVLVGENGVGKTTLINQILDLGVSSNGIIFIFQGDKEFWAYPQYSEKKIAFKSFKSYPNIVKFTNSKELYKPELMRSYHSEIIDASDITDLLEENHKDNKNEDIRDLNKVINQINFVDEHRDKIQEFVDFTKKLAEPYILADGLPGRSYQIKVNINGLKVIGKHRIYLLIDFFSVLINKLINERYQKDHTELWKEQVNQIKEDERRQLLYQAIAIDTDRFLPFKYGVSGIKRKVENIEIDETHSKIWIKLWHVMYILHGYFELQKNREIVGEFVIFDVAIEKIFKELKGYVFADSKEKKIFEEYISILSDNYKAFKSDNLDDVLKKKWEKIWSKNKEASEIIAKSITFLSYFDLSEQGYFVSHYLNTDKVWNGLVNIGINSMELANLKKLANLLVNNNLDNYSFSDIKSIADLVSKINIREIKQSLIIKWKGLSSGELAILELFSILYLSKKVLEKRRKVGGNFLLLLDEVDIELHPEWQRRWVSVALPVIGEIFSNYNLQIVMTTHSPIMLSDIYPENVVLMKKDSKGDVIFERADENNIITFGQNIHQLFTDSFFLRSTRGAYATRTINAAIKAIYKLNDDELRIDEIKSEFATTIGIDINEISDDKRFQVYLEKIINSIGEKMISKKLKLMYQNTSMFSSSENPDNRRVSELTTDELERILKERKENGL